MNIADNPDEWSSLPRENNIPKPGERSPERRPQLIMSGHTIDDYNRVRDTLVYMRDHMILSKHMRSLVESALSETPVDGGDE